MQRNNVAHKEYLGDNDREHWLAAYYGQIIATDGAVE